MRRLILALAPLVLIIALAGCGGASSEREAALTATEANAYTDSEFTECRAAFIDSSSWGQDGKLYMPCGPSKINIYPPSGGKPQVVNVGLDVSDVAPSPDGKYLYLAMGVNKPRRMVRQADGSYVLDPSWALAPYTLQGDNFTPRGHFIATDASGDIFLADGAWTEGQGDDGKNRGGGVHTVVEYSPDGQPITTIGHLPEVEDLHQACQVQHSSVCWKPGAFYWQLDGLTVTPDGKSLYTVEAGNDRVQRFDRQPNGSYAAAFSFGSTASSDPDRQGDCVGNGLDSQGDLSAPYDIALDDTGNIYVDNTSCHEVLKFDPSGHLLYAKTLGADRTTCGDAAGNCRPHSFAVSKDGSRIYVPQESKVLTSTAAAATDSDGDEVPDSADHCPAEAGPAANDGCPSKQEPLPTSCAAARKSSAGVTNAGGRLVGTQGPDVIVGTSGDDTIVGLGGNDLLCGGAGFDTIEGGPGNDTMDAGPGGGGLEYGPAAAAITINLSTGTASGEGSDRLSNFAEVYGSQFGDTITAGAGTHFIAAEGGNDKIVSRNTTAQTVSCGAGSDSVGADTSDSVKSDCESVDHGQVPTFKTLTVTGNAKAKTAMVTFLATSKSTGKIKYQCRFDASAFSSCASPKTYHLVGKGRHTVQVKAIDAFGRSATASRSFTL